MLNAKLKTSKYWYLHVYIIAEIQTRGSVTLRPVVTYGYTISKVRPADQASVAGIKELEEVDQSQIVDSHVLDDHHDGIEPVQVVRVVLVNLLLDCSIHLLAVIDVYVPRILHLLD